MKVLFGEWTFDAETRQLHRGRDAVHLTPKAFDLLKLLIAARPRVLTKAELQEALWPGVFVSEVNLFTLVSEIRTAIEDDARHPRFVRTVHGVGYAFSGEATEVSGSTSPTRVLGVLVTEGRQFPLPAGEHVIGRDPDISITLESTTVSRRHARLRVTPEVVTLEDLGSKNGTFLNEARVIGQTRVADGDRIRIGSLLTIFHRIGPNFLTETQQIDSDRGPSG